MKVSKKTRDERKKETHEVFTPPELINRMLAKFSEKTWQEDKIFLDPAAGNGNLLVEIYSWKVDKYGHDPEKALSTIYGVELMADNVAEMKLRLYKMAKDYGVDPEKASKILERNIICHDALTYDFNFE
jgi:type I restriction-modification system DNA methylase subunit